jgi:benzoyl-CoA reductase subunit D
MITAGIDCGAKNTKAVIMQDGKIIGKGMVPTGFDQAKAVEDSFALAVQHAGITRKDIQRIFGTGSGKDAIKVAEDTVNDIEAMAKGAHYLFPNARTVADAADFAINEKCAAGAGAFIEAMARALEVTIEEMGPLCLQSGRDIPMNAQCVIFAESEVVGLIHSKTSKADISKAIHDSIASRIVSMIRRIGVNEDVVLIGGLGHNQGFMDSMAKQLKVNTIYVPEDPEFGSAVGAAVSAAEIK